MEEREDKAKMKKGNSQSYFTHVYNIYLQVIYGRDKQETISDKLVLQRERRRGVWGGRITLQHCWKYNMTFVNAKDEQNKWNYCKNDSAAWYERENHTSNT